MTLLTANSPYKAGQKVRVTTGFFEGRIGKVSKQQDKVSGIWLDIKVVDSGTPSRIWFSLSEIEAVKK